METKKQRIEIIDATRGLAVALMVAHHALYDMQAFLGAPEWFYHNPVFNVLQVIFVGLFMFVSGISSRFSRGNIERGVKALLLGVAISYVSIRILDMPILFGILSVLGTFMLFYGVTRKFWDNIPAKLAITLYIALIILSVLALRLFSPTSEIPAVRDILYVLGWNQQGYISFDHQTILPGIFVFLLGTRIGEYVKDGKLPQWFYEKKFPFFPVVGRNALLIYILHQPVLYGITLLIMYLQGATV